MFASFLHSWLATGNPVRAVERAALYAGWKIGDSFPGAAMLTEQELSTLEAVCQIRATVGRWDTASRSAVRS